MCFVKELARFEIMLDRLVFLLENNVFDFVKLLFVFHLCVLENLEHTFSRHWFNSNLLGIFNFFGWFPINHSLEIGSILSNFGLGLDGICEPLEFLLNGNFSAFPEFSFLNVALYFPQGNNRDVFIILRVVDTDELCFLDLAKGLMIV